MNVLIFICFGNTQTLNNVLFVRKLISGNLNKVERFFLAPERPQQLWGDSPTTMPNLKEFNSQVYGQLQHHHT